MKESRLVRSFVRVVTVCVALFVGGEGSAYGVTLYVNADHGDDRNDGTSPATALRTIFTAADISQTGDEIIVAPGFYREGNISPRAFARVTFRADRSTGGDVVIDATDFPAAFLITGSLNVTIDGFIIYGGTFGIHVKTRSHQARLVNNVISNCLGNGIYIQDSDGAIIFNNLVYNNLGSGILVTGNVIGSRDVKIINNTVYRNANRGIFFAGSSLASSGGMTLNNIAEDNVVAEIQVNPISLPGHLKAGNVTTGRLAHGTPRDGTDVLDVEPGENFVDPAGPDGLLGGPGYADDNFRLRQLPGDGGGVSPAIDAGAALASALLLDQSTTSTGGQPDEGIVDAGFHYGNTTTGRVPEPSMLRFQEVYVDHLNGNNNNDGSSAESAFRTMQRAVDRSRGGHEIVLLPGTYREGDITLANLGLGSRPLRISGVGPESQVDAAGFQRGFLVERESRLELRNLVIVGASVAAVQVRRESELIASGITLRQNCGHGIWALQNSVVRLTDVEIAQNGRIGITAQDDSMLFITRGVIRGNRREGIRIRGGGGLDASDTVIAQNEREGVTVVGADTFEWRRGRVEGNGVTGLQIADTAITKIDDTFLRGNCGDGLRLLGSGTAAVSNFRICRNGSSGVVSHDVELSLSTGVLELNGLEGVQVKNGSLGASDVLALQNITKGASTFGSTKLSWQGGRIARNGSIGLQAVNTETVSVEDVGVYRNQGNGITFTNGAESSVTRAWVCHNNSAGLASEGFELSIKNGTFDSNQLEGVRVKGGALMATDVVAVRNGTKGISTFESDALAWIGGRVGDNKGNGIQAFGTRNVLIHGTMSYTNVGDGITIYDGDSASIVNNLIYGNTSTGILITNSGWQDEFTSPDMEILQNTVYSNTNRGLLMGDSRQVTLATAHVMRNVFAANGTAGISVSSPSMPGYVGDYNFSADRYGPFTPPGRNDIVLFGEPLFVDPAGPDAVLGGAGWADDSFHLKQVAAGQELDSPCVDAGGVTAVVAGLATMTTRTDGVADEGMVDVGYHYPRIEPVSEIPCVEDEALVRSQFEAWDCDLGVDTFYETADCSGDFRFGNDAGDCDGNGMVAVNELVTAVNVALGLLPMQRCWSADVNGDGRVSVDELISAVRNALRPAEMNCQL